MVGALGSGAGFVSSTCNQGGAYYDLRKNTNVRFSQIWHTMVFVTNRIHESLDEDFFVRAKISKFYENFYNLRPNKKSSAEDFLFVRKFILFGRRNFCSDEDFFVRNEQFCCKNFLFI